MKNQMSLYRVWLRWLLLLVFVCGNLLSTQAAQADSPCSTSNLHGGVITSDETWCAGVEPNHYLINDVSVAAGVTLTIQAGVRVDSAQGVWSKYLTVLGHLDINGTAENPVLLTHHNWPIQNWGGIFFDGSEGDGSGTINYATITHAGAYFLPPGCSGTCGNGVTAVFVKDLAAGKQVSINHSTITDNTRKGLFVVNGTVSVANSTFSLNNYPIEIVGSQSSLSYSENTFTDNAYPYYDNMNYTVQEDSIFLEAGAQMGQNFSLPVQNGLDAYVFLSGTTIPFGMTMTVQPGVTLRMAGDKYLNVQGHLDAVGTPTLPIHFSGIPSSTPGISLNWGGLYFDGTAGDGSGEISNAIVERGGSNQLPPGCSGTCGTAQTAVFVKDVPSDKLLNIQYSTISDSLSKGLYAVNSPGLHFDSNLVLGGRYGADIASDISINNLALLNQQYDGLIVENGNNVDARHLTIVNAAQSGVHVHPGGVCLLRNSILSQNAIGVWSEGSGQATLNTNLADANTIFATGNVTEESTIFAPAGFEADGYHIQITSKAVGVGLPGLSEKDIDGEGRPYPSDTRPDIGADEVQAGVYSMFLPMLIRN